MKNQSVSTCILDTKCKNLHPQSTVLYKNETIFYGCFGRSHLPLPCPMEVSSPLHLSVVSQDRLSTPCQPTPRQPPSQHSLDRDSPSLRARSPWSEVCPKNCVKLRSFCLLMNYLLFMIFNLSTASLSLSLSQYLTHLGNENDKQAVKCI